MSALPSDELLASIAERFKALADPMRLRILHALEGRERCVGEIVELVGSSQANVSKHLAVLRRAGLVQPRRCGMNVYYHADDSAVFRICRLACDSLSRQAARAAETMASGNAAWNGRG